MSNPVFKSVRQDMKEAIAHVETELLARDAKCCLNAALPEDVQDMQEGTAAKVSTVSPDGYATDSPVALARMRKE